jgi:DNA (cytosine-5)-methyltransferase 1
MLNDTKWERFHESSRRIYDAEGISPTLPTGAGGGHIPKLKAKMEIRRLTPIEYERLQSFPDNWTQFGKNNETISNTQRYKMCGNAVTVNVVKAIFEKLLRTIN